MYLLRLSTVIVAIGVFTALVLVECRWYQSGLIFYDLATKQIILPPSVSIHHGRRINVANLPIFSKLGQPCTCRGLMCGCCSGLHVKEYDFDQKMCANVTFVPQKEEAILNVYLNEESRARYGISARNPSPLCVPIMMPIPMAACIQMTDVGLKGDNLHMCMDFVIRMHTTDAMELHFNCLSMGLDGFQYLDKNGNPVIPRQDEDDNGDDDDTEADNEENDYYDDIEEYQDQPGHQQTDGKDDEYVGGEESGDGPTNVDENDALEEAEVEAVLHGVANVMKEADDANKIVKQNLKDGNATKELTKEQLYITDNLIKVYETV